MWRCGLIILIITATVAQAATVTVTKRGLGTGTVTGTLQCATDCTATSGEFTAGQQLSFGFESDRSGAEFMGWGGICGQFENQATCSFEISAENDRRFSGRYPVIVGLGYTRNGVCRAYLVGPLNYQYFNSLAEAFTAVKSGPAVNPVECLVSGPIYDIGNIDGTLVLDGGFPSFTPNSYPDGTTSTISGTLTVTTGTLTISGSGGVTLACGYTTVTGPYIITSTPLIIGATPCDFGFIVK